MLVLADCVPLCLSRWEALDVQDNVVGEALSKEVRCDWVLVVPFADLLLLRCREFLPGSRGQDASKYLYSSASDEHFSPEAIGDDSPWCLLG